MKLPLDVVWEIALWSPSASYRLSQVIRSFGLATLTEKGRTRLVSAFMREMEADTENGVMLYELLPNGHITGLFTEKDTTGTIIYQCEYVNNIQVGRIYRVRPDRTIRITDWAYDFKPTGVTTVYSTTDSVLERRHYTDGRLTGPFITYYLDGTTKSSSVYCNDVITDMHLEWHANGKLAVEAEYKHGKPVGTWRSWNRDGHLTTLEVHDETGRRYTSYYHAGGVHEDYYVGIHGITGKAFLWYDSGTLCSIREYLRDQRHGVSYRYYRDGTLAEKMQYDHGEKAGQRVCWYPGGMLHKRVNYRTTKHGDYYSAWPNGKTKRIATFSAGMLCGKEYLFDNEGNRIAIIDHSKINLAQEPQEGNEVP
jgi:antitoxin component YwqK of YwqJK toxin-antitoxin module